jgi:hypothetical protein
MVNGKVVGAGGWRKEMEWERWDDEGGEVGRWTGWMKEDEGVEWVDGEEEEGEGVGKGVGGLVVGR